MIFVEGENILLSPKKSNLELFIVMRTNKFRKYDGTRYGVLSFEG